MLMGPGRAECHRGQHNRPVLNLVPATPARPESPKRPPAGHAPGAAVVALAPRKPARLRPEDPGTTFLFTDIEGSTRLWEQEPERMAVAMARHDALCRAAVAAHGGLVVKGTGDGVHAIFADGVDAMLAAVHLQLAMAEPVPQGELALRVRCGMHCGASEPRDGDFFGPALNRAARVMGAAHGGQTLVTHEVAERVAARLPPPLTLTDLGAVRLRDLGGPQRVHQVVHPGLREGFPPLRSLEATPNNLTQQLNSFVGRERELAEVRELLGKTRLLTLLGMGGIGKSRLSVQLGAELMDEYPDGVWLVELAPLADPLLVPQALASVLGVKEEGGSSVTEALLGYVRDKTLLVILDNCEHVVHACADLAKRLLQAASGVRVLTSSRDVLQVAGETVYQVPTLTVPAATDGAEASTLGRHEAVRLFMDRATAVQPALRLTSENAATVGDICRRLDGIPLALELAAARTRALSLQAIASRLADRFRLLVSGDQTVLPRQRTLRALIDWSFDLLPEPERMLFRRLAVFAGGWTLDAAEAVGSGDGIDSAEVLDLLARLVEKSLVVMEPSGERYRMLETVRAYAAEKLAASGEDSATCERHVDHHLLLAEKARPGLVGPEQGSWLRRLDAERENLLVTHARCGAEKGLRLVYALRPYWLNRGLLDLGYRITVESLGREGAQSRDRLRFRGLSDAGWLAYFMGRYGLARQYLEEGLGIARDIGPTEAVARVLQPLGMACMGQGDVPAARAHLEEAVKLAREGGNSREVVAALNALAQLHRLQGQPEVAEPLYEAALALAREVGDREFVAGLLLNLVMVSVARWPEPGMRERLLDVLAIAEELGSKPAEQSAFEVCAGLAAAEGNATLAARLYGMAQGMASKTGLIRDPADDAFLKPLMLRSRASLGDAAFDAVEREGSALPPERTIQEARDWLRPR